jgi:hypothetical protein
MVKVSKVFEQHKPDGSRVLSSLAITVEIDTITGKVEHLIKVASKCHMTGIETDLTVIFFMQLQDELQAILDRTDWMAEINKFSKPTKYAHQ